jgi:hypothetical protein
MEELADLLADLLARGGIDGAHRDWPAARGRMGRLQDHSAKLRRLLGDNEPIDLGHGVASERDMV